MAGKDERRHGDERPYENDVSLTLTPADGQPFRWLPKHGRPLCIGEWLSQRLVTGFAHLPLYIATVVTISLIVQLVIWL